MTWVNAAVFGALPGLGQGLTDDDGPTVRNVIRRDWELCLPG